MILLDFEFVAVNTLAISVHAFFLARKRKSKIQAKYDLQWEIRGCNNC